MLLTIDLDLNQLIVAPGQRSEVTAINFKNGVSTSIQVQFSRSGVIQELDPAGGPAALGEFALKVQGEYDSDFVVSALSWVKSGTGTNTIYTFSPNFNTVALATLLGATGGVSDAIEQDSVTLMGEIQWTDSTGATYKTATFEATVANDVIRGTEGATATGNPGYWNKAEADGRYLRMDSGLYGSAALGANVSQYQVAGLTLPFDPVTVLAWVDQAGGTMTPIFGEVDTTTLSAAGFTVSFNGLPPDTAHVLHWIALPPPSAFTTEDDTTPAAQQVAAVAMAAAIDLSKPGLTVLDLTAATGVVALTLNNVVPGREYVIEAVQGAVARNATFPANTKQKGGGGNLYIASAANARDLIRLTFDGNNYLISIESNYA